MNDLDDFFGDVVDFRLGRESRNTKAQAGVRIFVVETEGAENVRWLQGRRSAGGSGRQADIFQGHQQGLALDVLERDVETTRVAFSIAVEQNVRDVGCDIVAKALGEAADMRVVVLQQRMAFSNSLRR